MKFWQQLMLPGPAGHRQLFFRDWLSYWFLQSSLLLGTGAWLGLTPEGFWGKLWAIAYSSCHQIPSRSFFVHEHQGPFCARCTGMYLGAGVGIIALAFKGRRIRWPRLSILLVLAAFLVFFGLDGLNSFAQFLPDKWQLYTSTNSLRLLSGLGLGLGIAVIAMPIFNRAFWREGKDERILNWGTFSLLLVFLAGAAAGILSGWAPLLYFSFVFTPLSFLLLLILLHTSLALIFLRQDGQAKDWGELRAPLLLGALLALLQISAIALLRYLLTGTWAPINL